MAEGSDSEGGRPREYGEDEVLMALRDLDDGSGVRTGKVADRVGCSTRTALRRLTSLEEDKKVKSVEVTERMKLWYVTED